MPPGYEAVLTGSREGALDWDIEMNNPEENSGDARQAETATPSADTARADRMNSATGMATETERLIAEPMRCVEEPSLKARQQTW